MPDDWIELFPTPLDCAAAVRYVTCPEAGGIDVFLGTTRAETHPQFGELLALDYAAYEEMAVAEIRKLLEQARQQWPVCRAAVLHRLGRVAVGEASVVIAVSCPHRGEAFAACRYLIDELKRSVPLWKKDVFARGGEWHHPG